eukprot:scaffold42516_cov30-Phaeocystis_antarctica.AAC.1
MASLVELTLSIWAAGIARTCESSGLHRLPGCVRLISVGELSGRAIATVTSPARRAAPVPVGHTYGRLDLIVA